MGAARRREPGDRLAAAAPGAAGRTRAEGRPHERIRHAPRARALLVARPLRRGDRRRLHRGDRRGGARSGRDAEQPRCRRDARPVCGSATAAIRAAATDGAAPAASAPAASACGPAGRAAGSAHRPFPRRARSGRHAVLSPVDRPQRRAARMARLAGLQLRAAAGARVERPARRSARGRALGDLSAAPTARCGRPRSGVAADLLVELGSRFALGHGQRVGRRGCRGACRAGPAGAGLRHASRAAAHRVGRFGAAKRLAARRPARGPAHRARHEPRTHRLPDLASGTAPAHAARHTDPHHALHRTRPANRAAGQCPRRHRRPRTLRRSRKPHARRDVRCGRRHAWHPLHVDAAARWRRP